MTNKEKELLLILNEECSEVQHSISKVLRNGIESYNQYTGEIHINRLGNDLGKVVQILETLIDSEIILEDDVNSGLKNNNIGDNK